MRVVGPLDVARFPWCANAVVVSVTDGRGALRTAGQPSEVIQRNAAGIYKQIVTLRRKAARRSAAANALLPAARDEVFGRFVSW